VSDAIKINAVLKKKGFPPGQHGQLKKKLSDYGVQLREKQRLKGYMVYWKLNLEYILKKQPE